MRLRKLLLFACVLIVAAIGRADEPTAVCIFPAGGQRGTAVSFRVCGHYLHDACEFYLDGPGIAAVPRLRRADATIWFEGPVIPLPDSQAKEDYPVDHLGAVQIAADATPGVRWWRVATSQGVTKALPFVIGDLPEIVEQEIDGQPLPEQVQLPVTINGRIFPREDRDIWCFDAVAGQRYTCEVTAARIQSPLDSRLTLFTPDGAVAAVNDDMHGKDSRLSFVASHTGQYRLQIEDADLGGLQHYVYRLTITSGADVFAVYPRGARRGEQLQLELIGQSGETAAAVVDVPADAGEQLQVAGRPELLLEVGDLEELREAEPNDAGGAAGSGKLDTVWNGRIQQAGDVDFWHVDLQQGQAVELDLRAARLNSPLDGVLKVLNSEGKQLAEADDTAGLQSDASLQFTAPAAGRYTVAVSDRFASRGGPAFSYRLVVRTAAGLKPDFEITAAADTARVLRGGELKQKVTAVRKHGFAGQIRLSVTGLPAGVSCEDVVIESGKSEATLVLKAAADAPVNVVPLAIIGRSTDTEQPLEHALRIPPPASSLSTTPVREQIWLSVSVATPFRVIGTFETRYAARGSSFVRHYSIDRGGYEGPLTVRLSERQNRHLQGVTGPEIVVPAGVSEFDYTIFLPPWMEIGRTSRTCLMAVGHLTTEDGRQHPVSYTSFEQNDQIIVLVDPERMSVHLPQTSLRAMPGTEVRLPFEVRRGNGVNGVVTVQLEIPQHMQGLTVASVLLPPDQSAGELILKFASGPLGPWNMPLKVSASCQPDGKLVRAEAILSVGSEQP
jgi:hypothetical protein